MTSPYRAEPPPIARYVLRTNPRFTSQLRGALAISTLLLAITGTYWSGAKRDPAGEGGWAPAALEHRPV